MSSTPTRRPSKVQFTLPAEERPLYDSSQPSVGGTFEERSNLGLTSREAQERLAKDGPNLLDPSEKVSFLAILLTQMKNVIFLLTTCAAFLTWSIGDEVKAYVLVGIVFVVCLLNTIGEYSAQDAAGALAKMTSPKAEVFRDGKVVTLETKELVVGDVVQVNIGDIVPADMAVIETVDLQTNEAALTGEPHEQSKTLEPKDEGAAFPSNMLFSATSVVAGYGKGEVVATGMRTQVGLIAKRLKSQDQTLDINPLQQSINLLGRYIGGACCAVVIVATFISYASGYQNPMSPCADDDDQCLLVTSIVRGLILAVSIIPHGLPFIVMVMLRVGSSEMAKRQAVVTKQSTVDYLGATTVICTDKTGTLTEGKMTAEVVFGLCHAGAAGEMTESALGFYPLRGNCPNGGLFQAAALETQVKRSMDSKFDLQQRRQAYSEPGLTDFADPDTTPQPGATPDELLAKAHLACAYLNVYGSTLDQDPSTFQWSTSGSMTEVALKVAAAKGGLYDGEGHGLKMMEAYPRDSNLEVPFTSKRKMMATVHRLPANRQLETLKFPEEATHIAVIKGAPDMLLPKLHAVARAPSAEGAAATLAVPGGPFTERELGLLKERNSDFSRRALRTLLLAVRPLGEAEAAALAELGAKERLMALLAPSDEVKDSISELCFLSLWGIFDPPRSMAQKSVEECHRAGIRVVMITGDQQPTAVAVGRQVSIIADGDDPAFASSPCAELYDTQESPVYHRQLRRLRSKGYDEAPANEQPEMTRTDSGEKPVKEETNEQESPERKYRSKEELDELSSRVSVWSRAAPTDKVTIVESLSSQGHITAMTGDGVNDAPALKKAMVGVSMGISGTEVAKGASELILMDDDFSTIVAAIREGRKIYANVQKYVVFNLSIKAGECTCLLTSISSGMPMPIRGLQLLFNLICTHIIPTMSLAWEDAEDYLMRVPPRETKQDLVVPRVMWLFRWVPFVICMPTAVLTCLSLGVWMHTGFLQGNSIIGSSRVGALEEGLDACEYAGVLDLDGRFLDDASPFHCRCFTHPSGLPWEAPVQVDQWGRVGAQAELDSVFDRWTGGTAHVFDQAKTPWRDGAHSLLEQCKDHHGVRRWCWKKPALATEDRPLLPMAKQCASYGARLGQSMAYVTIHLGEILSLCTYRTDGFFLPYVFSNPVYTALLIFNLCGLMVFIYVPPVANILELAPLTPSRFCTGAFFAFCLMGMNEVCKVMYRIQVKVTVDRLEKEAFLRSRGVNAKAKV
mmetsp:Transcript_107650/g.347435  ORF Transcript_107650/g.347435 Transcript_107650/m.347435 type:complete len:1249 (-) Transcript_107650:93-3839(-)